MSRDPRSVADPAAAAAVIRAINPDGAVDSIDPLGQGDFCTAYAVNGRWVVRFARHDAAVHGLRREASLLPVISEQLPLHVPRPRIITGQPGPVCTIHRLLPGPALTSSRYLQLSDTARDRCASQLAAFLRQLHAVDLEPARQCGIPQIDYRHWFGGLLSELPARALTRIPKRDLAFVKRTITDFIGNEQAMAFRPSLLHGDLGPEHVLYDPDAGSLTGVIDFGDMAIGDPAWDLIFLYEDYGLDFLRRFVRAYHPSDGHALLTRMFGLYRMAAIEWVMACAAKESIDPCLALEQLARLRMSSAELLAEVLRVCDPPATARPSSASPAGGRSTGSR